MGYYQPGYFYGGHERVRLFFDTPNQCATVAAIFALLLSAAFIHISEKTFSVRFSKFALSSILFGSIAILFILIAETYSRGGFFSTLVGYLSLAITQTRRRWLPLTFLLGFIICVYLTPLATTRVATIVNVATDASIYNRLLLWKGALAMTSDNWLSGVGFDNFSAIYANFYQPESMHLVYSSALNDFLTISACEGLPVFYIFITITSIILYIEFKISRQYQDVFISGALSATVAYLFASIWSPFLIFQYARIGICVGFITSLIFVSKYIKEIARQFFRTYAVPVLLFSTIASALIAISACWAASRYEYRHNESALFHSDQRDQLYIYAPKNEVLLGTILFISPISATSTARPIIRAIASNGYQVLAYYPKIIDTQAARNSSSIFEQARKLGHIPLFIIGYGEGGRLSMSSQLLFNKPDKLILINSPTWSPINELSPVQNVSNLQSPLLILHSNDDHFISTSDEYNLYSKCTNSEKETSIEIFPSIVSTGIVNAKFLEHLMMFLQK